MRKPPFLAAARSAFATTGVLVVALAASAGGAVAATTAAPAATAIPPAGTPTTPAAMLSGLATPATHASVRAGPARGFTAAPATTPPKPAGRAAGPRSLAHPANASTAGATLFNQPFNNNTVNPAYPVTTATGDTTACLTAAGNTSTGVLRSCPTSTDPQGSGTLRLNAAGYGGYSGVFAAASMQTSWGLDVTFNAYQYGGGPQADGIAFMLAAVDPADPLPPTSLGGGGGSLGYVSLADAYLGVGFDTYGGFSSTEDDKTGCTNPPYLSPGGVPGQVVVRGPGNGGAGYCAINSTATTSSSPPVSLDGASRAASKVPVEVAINPSGATVTTASGISVPADSYEVVFTAVGATTATTLTGTLPTVPAGLYPSNWTDSNGIPKQLAFGWAGASTNGTDTHEIDNAQAASFTPPQLSVAQTSYSGSSPQPGDPVTYTVVPSVLTTGPDETAPVTLTDRLPPWVVPVGAFGSGWACQVQSDIFEGSITCTDSTTPFPNGTSLPPVTVVAIATSFFPPGWIQELTSATASSSDAGTVYSSGTTPGTPPAAPANITFSPSGNSLSPNIDVTVAGSNLGGATAIEIGTAAQQQAGSPALTLLPCQSGSAPGCFTANANGTLDISDMPSWAASSTEVVTIVTQGVAGSGTYA